MFLYSAHKKLWEWLANNPNKFKSDWPGWKGNGGTYQIDWSLCFACQYTDPDIGCGSCPLDTDTDPDNDYDSVYCLGGLFWLWMRSAGEEKKSLALQIANLPLKEGVEWE